MMFYDFCKVNDYFMQGLDNFESRNTQRGIYLTKKD